MQILFISRCVVAIASLMLSGYTMAATTKYITDEFEVTMRSGTSTSNSIVQLLKSGQQVTVLEEDLASKYSLVEIDNEKKGYVLSRFLESEPGARQRLGELQETYALQEQKLAVIDEQLVTLKQDLADQQAANDVLKSTLLATENELSEIFEASENALAVLEQKNQLETIVQELRTDNDELEKENAVLRDSTRMDWFLRGAAVSLVAFLLGILITRIRWRKQDSWGSY